MKNYWLFIGLFLLFFSGSNQTTILGYKPIYVSAETARQVKFLAAQEMKNQGKIYIKDQYIFIGDVGLGVHVIDNSDPANPVKIGFLQIYGNHDIAIKDHALYADNFRDLVTIDISSLENPQVVQRVENVYETFQENYPPNVPYGTYFECVDESKGFVIGWVQQELEEAHCYTIY